MKVLSSRQMRRFAYSPETASWVTLATLSNGKDQICHLCLLFIGVAIRPFLFLHFFSYTLAILVFS